MARTKGALGKKTIERIKYKISHGLDLTPKEKEQVNLIKKWDILVRSKSVFDIERIIMPKKKKGKKIDKSKIISYKTISILPSEKRLVKLAYEHHNKTSDKYIYVWDNFFVNEKNDEYLYWNGDDKFIRTKIIRGTGVTKKKLLKWKDKFLKQN